MNFKNYMYNHFGFDLIKVKQTNQTIISIPSADFLFSYSTLVAVYKLKDHVLYIVENISKTTTRHVGYFKQRCGTDTVISVDIEWLTNYFMELNHEYYRDIVEGIQRTRNKQYSE